MMCWFSGKIHSAFPIIEVISNEVSTTYKKKDRLYRDKIIRRCGVWAHRNTSPTTTFRGNEISPDGLGAHALQSKLTMEGTQNSKTKVKTQGWHTCLASERRRMTQPREINLDAIVPNGLHPTQWNGCPDFCFREDAKPTVLWSAVEKPLLWRYVTWKSK